MLAGEPADNAEAKNLFSTSLAQSGKFARV
jgi:hypothetical protein